MEILGIIPARGGSKSIPGKNLAMLAGKPLLAYACSAAAASVRITRVIVSTDDEKIAAVALACGAEVPFLRPAELADDDTPALPVILHALAYLEKEEHYVPDIVVYLQPTSPLRRAEHIDGTIEVLMKSDADSAVSVVEVPHQFNPASVMVMEGGILKSYESGPQVLRRQDKQKVYARNGPAVLAIKRTTLTEKNSLYGEATASFIMPTEFSIDIDMPFDLEMAEFLLKKRNA